MFALASVGKFRFGRSAALALLTGIVWSAGAQAQGYHPATPVGSTFNNYAVTCWTSSRGISFQFTGYDARGARIESINQCQRDFRGTDDHECRYNSVCQGETYGDWFRCQTTARYGNSLFRFRTGSADSYSGRNEVIRQCEARGGGYYNADCRNDAFCESGAQTPPPPPVYNPPYNPPGGGYPPPPPPPPPGGGDMRQYVCSTESNGRRFNVPGRGYYETRAKVVNICREQRPYTDFYQCDANAYCQ